LTLGIPGENPGTVAVRKYAGSSAEAALEAREWLDAGSDLLRQAGVTRQFQGKPMLSPKQGDALLKAVHGEGPVPPGFQPVVTDLQDKMAQVTADMLTFDPKMSEKLLEGVYFPRIWRQPKATRTGLARMGAQPFYLKKRTPLTYTEMRAEGWSPKSWNPYDLLAERYMAAADYQQGVILKQRLQKTDMVAPRHEAPEGWRVPKVGPAFEGRPYVDEAGKARMTPATAVPNRIADVLESEFGLRPELRIGGKDVVRILSTASQGAKRIKLLASLFQHLDFAFRTAGEAVTPNAILTGGTINFPAYLAKAFRGQFSEVARRELRQHWLSNEPILKGTKISPRMLVQEGVNIGPDTTMLRRSIRSFLDDAMKDTPVTELDRVRERIDAVNRFFEKGLFENIYPLSMEFAARNHIVPVLKQLHPKWSDRQIAAQAARDINVMYSNLPVWQSVFQQPAMREITRQLIFSTNESESWIRGALMTVKGPSKRVWLEHWAGLFIFMSALANIIHFATTGKPLPVDRYNPVTRQESGIPVGYNYRFLAPDIPLKDENGENLTVDLMGQADTLLHWLLDPAGALQARENVLPRAAMTQITGRAYGGTPLRGPEERAIQAGYDVLLPIGMGAVAQAARQVIPGAGGVVPVSERRIGPSGQLVQATGVNLRSTRRDIELLTKYDRLADTLVPANLKNAWAEYKAVPSVDRATWLKTSPYRFTLTAFEDRVARAREDFRRKNPLLDAYLVELGRVSKPLTLAGQEALRKRRGQLPQSALPRVPTAPSPVGQQGQPAPRQQVPVGSGPPNGGWVPVGAR